MAAAPHPGGAGDLPIPDANLAVRRARLDEIYKLPGQLGSMKEPDVEAAVGKLRAEKERLQLEELQGKPEEFQERKYSR